MLAAQRQARILEEVQRTGGVRVNDLTRLLGVSDMTVRRDLDALDSRGLLTKVHGGATVRRSGSTVHRPDQLTTWLQDAGFAPPRRVRTARIPGLALYQAGKRW